MNLDPKFDPMLISNIIKRINISNHKLVTTWRFKGRERHSLNQQDELMVHSFSKSTTNQGTKFGPVTILNLLKRINDLDHENEAHRNLKWQILRSRSFTNISKLEINQQLEFALLAFELELIF